MNWFKNIDKKDDYIVAKIKNGNKLVAKIITNENKIYPTLNKNSTSYENNPLINYDYSYFISIINSSNTEQAFIRIRSKIYSPQLLLGLFNYFYNIAPLLVAQYEKTIRLVEQNKRWSDIIVDPLPRLVIDDMDDLYNNDNFIKKHKDEEFTQKLIAELFIRRIELNISKNECETLLLKHTENFHNAQKDVKTELDVCRYVMPILFNFTDSELEFFDDNKISVKRYTIESLKLLYKLYSLHVNYDKRNIDFNMRIKDYRVPDNIANNIAIHTMYDKAVAPDNTEFIVGDMRPDIIHIINDGKSIGEPTIINTINNLTIKEYNKIYGFIDYYDKTDDFLKTIEFGISEENHKDSLNENDLQIMKNMFEELFSNTKEVKKVIGFDYSPEDNYIANPDDFYFKIERYGKRKTFNSNIRTVLEYAKNRTDFINQEIIVCKDIINEHNDFWLNSINQGSSYMILQKLLKLMDGYEIIQLLSEFKNYPALTLDQWLNYIDNYEEYKNMPVSWWIELV